MWGVLVLATLAGSPSCNQVGSCSNTDPLRCTPSSQQCIIHCNGENSCENSVFTCDQAAQGQTCDFTCQGRNSCHNAVFRCDSAGSGQASKCVVRCSQAGACNGATV
eukprot:Hpha_TRINITY_DN37306_c0_g1::TRINITY_DN37306_c0_g1_i1::g.103747::m.103747